MKTHQCQKKITTEPKRSLTNDTVPSCPECHRIHLLLPPAAQHHATRAPRQVNFPEPLEPPNPVNFRQSFSHKFSCRFFLSRPLRTRRSSLTPPSSNPTSPLPPAPPTPKSLSLRQHRPPADFPSSLPLLTTRPALSQRFQQNFRNCVTPWPAVSVCEPGAALSQRIHIYIYLGIYIYIIYINMYS